MKKIEATIRASKFEDVQEALHNIGIDYFTFIDVKGIGKQKSQEVVYRGAFYDVGSISRTMLEIVVTDDRVEETVSCILKAARTGEIGDGKIFISDISKVIRIRTGETDKDAL